MLMRKRVLSLCMAFCMLLTFLPISVSADKSLAADDTTMSESADASASKEGADNLSGLNCHEMTELWFGDTETANLMGNMKITTPENTVLAYFDWRMMDYPGVSLMSPTEEPMCSNIVIKTRQLHTAAVEEYQKTRNIMITDAETTVQIDEESVTYHKDGTVTLYAYEWVFFDYDDLNDGVGGSDVSGYGTWHKFTLKPENGVFQIIADEYDEADLFGINTVADTPKEAESLVGEGESIFSDESATLQAAYSYNPSAAVAYADKWVYHGATQQGVTINFPGYYNNSEYHHFKNADCANYVSQCLSAGGLPQVASSSGWYYKSVNDYSASWTMANKLRDWMASHYGTLVKVNSSNYKQVLFTGNPIFHAPNGEHGHAAICVGTNSAGEPILNAHNYDRYHVKWDPQYVTTVQIAPGTPVKRYVLDVNGLLDGVSEVLVTGYGTFDIQVGDRFLDDVSDFCEELPAGTSYKITDIKATDGHVYQGCDKALEGTVNETTDIVLKFDTLYSLDVNGLLDGNVTGWVTGYGTFDIQVGDRFLDDVTDFCEWLPRRTTYKITDVKAINGRVYQGSEGSLEGVLNATTAIVLKFGTDSYLVNPIVYNADYYRSQHKDLREAFGDNDDDLLYHWITIGIDEGRQASPTFSAKWYMNRHTDVANALGDKNYRGAVAHFFEHGAGECRETSEEFFVNAYRENYNDLQKAFDDDVYAYFLHYINYGRDEGRIANRRIVVNFNANGGSCSPTSQPFTAFRNFGTLPTPTRANYTFDGWWTSASGGTRVLASSVANSLIDVTLYAHWTAKKCDALFYTNYSGVNYLRNSDFLSEADLIDGRWGSRDTSVSTISVDSVETHNSYHSLKIVNTSVGSSGKDLSVFTSTQGNRENDGCIGDNKSMTLSFWAKSSAEGTKMYFRWGYENTYHSVTLSEQWKKYTVTMNKTVSYGSYIHPYVDRAGTVWLSEIQLEDGTNATAFKPENGGLHSSVTETYAEKYSLPVDPIRNGYTFDGWYTSARGGDKVTNQTNVTATASHTLYAHWTEIPAERTLGSIEIITLPDKTAYTIGETLDTTGLTVRANYSDDTSEELSDGFTVSGFDSSSAGTKDITVTYHEKTASFSIVVNEIDKPQIVVGNGNASREMTIDIPVTIQNNPGIAGAMLAISYDKSALTLNKISQGPLFEHGSYSAPSEIGIVQWYHTEDVKEDGVLFILQFTVNETAQNGSYNISVGLRDGIPANLSNADSNIVNAQFISGMLEITSGIRGDVTGDGVVAINDVVKVARAVAGSLTLTESEKALADVTGDGVIAINDVVKLARYVAGNIASLQSAEVASLSGGESTVIEVATVSGNPGETVRVPVSITSNPGIAGAQLDISFDEGLTLKNIAKGGVLSAGTFNPDVDNGRIQWYYDQANVTNTGVLFTLEFEIGAETQNGDAYAVTVNVKDGITANLSDYDFNPVNAEFKPGKVQIAGTADNTAITTVSRNGNTITANVVCADSNATVFCAVYNNSGKMIAVRSAQITGESNYQFQFDGQQFDYAKAFIVDGNFCPLCESKKS